MKFNRLNKGLIAIGTLLALAISMPFAASILTKAFTSGRIYSTLEQVPEREVGLVLGAAAYPARLSAVLQDRVDTAIELYEADKVQKLIMTGAPNEAEAMVAYAADKGVPEADLMGDPRGLNTMASIQNAVAERSMTIVSQRYHLPRALFIARHLGIDAVGLTADKRDYLKMVEFKKRELLATTKAMLDLFFF